MGDEKLRTILLVDDDAATNFLDQRAIGRVGCADEVVTVGDGEAALAFLTTPREQEYPRPELIFLDMNMPGMNGWEFLEAYAHLPSEQRARKIVVMLTTSLEPEDRRRAEAPAVVDEFRSKPLTPPALRQVLATHFPARWG